LQALAPYQVNEQLTRHASNDHIVMHCMPQHIGEEITADVAYGSHSVIFDQAENRLHTQKAVALFLLGVPLGDTGPAGLASDHLVDGNR
jgi:ornithine carbamoyltransferase